MDVRLQELVASLGRLEGSGSGLELVSEQLLSLTRAEQSMVYTLERHDDGLEMGAGLARGISPSVARTVFNEGLKAAGTKKFLAYNPWRPEPRQRNRALTTRQIMKLSGGTPPPMLREGYPRMGVGQSDNLRMLVCDGPTLLAWVGVFRIDAFTPQEQRLLEQLGPPLRSRLKLELQLEGARLRAAALDVMLDQLPGEGYVVHATTQRLRVVLANRPGREALDQDGAGVHAALRRAVAGRERSGAFTVLRFAEQGLPEYALITRRAPPIDRLSRNLALAQRRWSLTRKQTEVLTLLARGVANKTIALQLECAESTVETHVTALLSRAQVDSRAALVAALWSLEE